MVVLVVVVVVLAVVALVYWLFGLPPTAKAIPGRNTVGLVLNYAHRPCARR